MIIITIKKKVLVCTFFYACYLLVGISHAQSITYCEQKVSLDPVAVDYVIDGDTVKLKSGNKLRFSAINTPEINRKNPDLSDAFAIRAKEYVARQLGRHPFSLATGPDKKDRHGRLLGHPFLKDGRNLSALLLGEGMGAYIAIPPNIRFADCYQQAETHARKAGKGIWSLADTVVKYPNTFSNGGFHIYQGPVSNYTFKNKRLILNIGHIQAMVDSAALPYFTKDQSLANIGKRYKGKVVEIRGWFFRARAHRLWSVWLKSDATLYPLKARE